MFQKQRLFGLQMRECIPLKEHLHELNFVLMELCDINVKIEDEDLTMILLCKILRVSYINNYRKSTGS